MKQLLLAVMMMMTASVQAQQAEEGDLDAKYATELVKVGSVAPDFTMQTIDGKPFTLSELKGRVVVLDFWATWCPDCRKEIPEVKNIYKKYQKRNNRYNDYYDINLNKLNRFKNEELIYLENYLYNLKIKKYEKETKNINLFLSKNQYSEIEYVAKNIIKLVKNNNYKFNEIITYRQT